MTTTYTAAGNTYPQRQEFKALGWVWNSTKKTWTGSRLSHQLRMAIKHAGLVLTEAPEIKFDDRCGRYYRVLPNGMWCFVSAANAALETAKTAPVSCSAQPAGPKTWRVWTRGGWELSADC